MSYQSPPTSAVAFAGGSARRAADRMGRAARARRRRAPGGGARCPARSRADAPPCQGRGAPTRASCSHSAPVLGSNSGAAGSVHRHRRPGRPRERTRRYSFLGSRGARFPSRAPAAPLVDHIDRAGIEQVTGASVARASSTSSGLRHAATRRPALDEPRPRRSAWRVAGRAASSRARLAVRLVRTRAISSAPAERLHQVVVGPRVKPPRQRSPAPLWAVEHDHRQPRGRGISDVLRSKQLEPIEHRHHHVGQDQVRAANADRFQRRFPSVAVATSKCSASTRRR